MALNPARKWRAVGRIECGVGVALRTRGLRRASGERRERDWTTDQRGLRLRAEPRGEALLGAARDGQAAAGGPRLRAGARGGESPPGRGLLSTCCDSVRPARPARGSGHDRGTRGAAVLVPSGLRPWVRALLLSRRTRRRPPACRRRGRRLLPDVRGRGDGAAREAAVRRLP